MAYRRQYVERIVCACHFSTHDDLDHLMNMGKLFRTLLPRERIHDGRLSFMKIPKAFCLPDILY